MEHPTDKIEKLENLPSKTGKRDIPDDGVYRWRSSVPFARVNAWIRSKIGKHIDKVLSEWVHAVWVPVEHRNRDGLYRYALDKVVRIGDNLYDRWGMPMGRYKMIYVDPDDKIIKESKVKRINYRKVRTEQIAQYCIFLGKGHQLIKQKGIWYEIRFPEKVQGIYGVVNFPDDKPFAIETRSEFLFYKKQLSSAELKKYKIKNG